MDNNKNITEKENENSTLITEETAESENEKLEKARAELIGVIKSKTPEAAQDFVVMSLQSTINTLSSDDCVNMAKIIKEKGLVGALTMGKKMKKKIQKSGEDINSGRVD